MIVSHTEVIPSTCGRAGSRSQTLLGSRTQMLYLVEPDFKMPLKYPNILGLGSLGISTWKT
jgi:hypothetical protein